MSWKLFAQIALLIVIAGAVLTLSQCAKHACLTRCYIRGPMMGAQMMEHRMMNKGMMGQKQDKGMRPTK